MTKLSEIESCKSCYGAIKYSKKSGHAEKNTFFKKLCTSLMVGPLVKENFETLVIMLVNN